MCNLKISEQCLEMFKEAIERVDKKYFYFPIASKNKENTVIYRERVYCYELYHQLRTLQENSYINLNKQVDINCEPNKRGHDWIANGCNPDFIFHKAGKMNGNYLVVEVKNNLNISLINSCEKIEGVYKDFTNLCKFVKKYKYQKGCFYLYGQGENKKDKIKKIINLVLQNNNYDDSVLQNIEIIIKEKHNSELLITNMKKIIE